MKALNPLNPIPAASPATKGAEMKLTPIRAIAVAAIAALTAVGLVACSPGSSEPDPPVSVTIATPGAFLRTTWDHASVSLYFLSQSLVYEPLVVWDPDTNEYEPWLAESFEISEDGLTMTLTVRNGVTFADGTILDAEAVAQSINAAYSAGQISSVEGTPARAIADDTVEFRATRPITPDSIIMLQFSTIPILPSAALDDPTLVAERPNGTGPYVLKDSVPETSASYERNETYWNPDVVEFDEITLLAIDDKVAALNALKSGQVDAAEVDPSMGVEAEASGLTVDSVVAGLDLVVFLDRIGADNPALQDVRVRQALNYAIDRATIVEQLLYGYGSTSTQPFDPASTEYVEGGDDGYSYDPDKARELLAEAGYADGFTFKLPRLTFTTIDYSLVVAEYFQQIGVTIEWIDAADTSELFGMLTSGEGGIDGVIYNLPYIYLIPAYSDQSWFVSQPIDDPALLEIVERYTGAPALHEQALEDYGEYILENAWYLVLAHPEAVWASTSNIEVNPSGGPLGAFLPRVQWFSSPGWTEPLDSVR